MKRLVLILLLLSSTLYGSAQQNRNNVIAVSGKVVDAKGVACVNTLVEITDSNNNIIASTITGLYGNYVLTIPRHTNEYTIHSNKSSDYYNTTIYVDKVYKEITLDLKLEQRKTRRIICYQVTACRMRTRIQFFDPYNPSPMNRTFSSDDIRRLAH